MRILTNPGANLPAHLLERYRIAVTPSNIVVDGESHDCREEIPLSRVDEWVARAKEYPYVLGTSAAEFAKQCLAIGEQDREILIVMSSRKIIQSHDAAKSAARTLEQHPHGRHLRIRVVDSLSTDLGLGLPVLAAAQAMRAGARLDDAGDLVETLATRGCFVFVPRTLHNLIKGGRASFLRALVAKMLGVRPMLAMIDGEAQMVGKCSAKADYADVIGNRLAQSVKSRRVWAGIAHGGAPEDARALADILYDLFDVQYMLIRSITPPVYLHAGPGMVGGVVFPIDDLPIPVSPPGA